MSLFNCAKCGCIENTATSSYWFLTRPRSVEEYDWDESLIEYKGKPLCSECAKVVFDRETGRDKVIPGKWHGKFEREFKELK